MLTATQKIIIVAVIGFGLGFGSCFIWLSGNDVKLAKSVISERSESESSSNTDTALKEALQEKVSALTEQLKEKQKAALISSGTPTLSSNSVSATISSSASISVKNQKAGNKAIVDSVTFSNPGWLVVYEYTGSRLGRVLGAFYRGAGSYKDVDVDLLQNTIPGLVYAVTVSSDDGDRNYNFRLDIPVVDSNGKTILGSFTALDK